MGVDQVYAKALKSVTDVEKTLPETWNSLKSHGYDDHV